MMITCLYKEEQCSFAQASFFPIEARYHQSDARYQSEASGFAFAGKFQVMFLGTKEPVDFVINDILIPVTDSVKLLGIIID